LRLGDDVLHGFPHQRWRNLGWALRTWLNGYRFDGLINHLHLEIT
jgi:hypothetical protein